MKGNAEALTVSGSASRAAVQELTRAYQELATKNAKNLPAALQALAAVKSPAEFIELQQRLIKEGVEAAVSDSRHIAQLPPPAALRASEKADRGGAEDRPDLGQIRIGSASRAAVQELTRAYQELATKNAKNLPAALQALAAVKSPAEFIELQQRLIKEGVEAAVSDSRHIAQLTAAVFTAALRASEKADRGGAEDRPDLGQIRNAFLRKSPSPSRIRSSCRASSP